MSLKFKSLLFMCLAVLAENGIADGDTLLAFDPNANEGVHAIAVLSDGKYIIGGKFTSVGGEERTAVARLNHDGSLDASFDPQLQHPRGNPSVYSVSEQADGKIVIGGSFSAVGGNIRNNVARLNSDGSVDVDFDPDVNETVSTSAIQSDGKILIAGVFTEVGGTVRNRIARLNLDGSLDEDFNPDVTGAHPVSDFAHVLSMAIQDNGQIVLAGEFRNISGVNRNNIGRINADGSLDLGFDPDVTGGFDTVQAVNLQADGRMLIGGYFEQVGVHARKSLARLESDGSLDLTFDPNITFDESLVLSIGIQIDGKAIVGGASETINEVERRSLIRLHVDGSVDDTFQAVVGDDSSFIRSIAITPENTAVIGGNFSSVNGISRNNIAQFERLTARVNVSAVDARKREGDVGTDTNYVFDVIRTINTTGTSSIEYTIEGQGTSPADETDFGGEFSAGEVIFLDGEHTKTIEIKVTGDSEVEPNETFAVTLSNPIRAIIENASAQGLILDDDYDHLCLPIKTSSGKVAVICL